MPNYEHVIEDTAVASGSASAPAGGAAIAAQTLKAGNVYKIRAISFQSATVDANVLNMRLIAAVTGRTLGTLPSTSNPTVSEFDRVSLAANETGVTVIAINAAGAGSAYNVIVESSRID